MKVPVLHGGRITLRPLEDEDVERLHDIVMGPGVREWWDYDEDPDSVKEGLRGDGSAFAIEVDGELAGWLGFSEEDEPDWKVAGLDIALAPPYQARGLGPEALRVAIDWLVAARGHHRFTIDPDVRNERAITAYSAVGFRPVGVMRRCFRAVDGEWHDALLMDLLAEELPETPPSRG